MFRSLFINAQGQWRNGCWIALFFLLLAVFLFPLLLWSQQQKIELSLWLQAALVLIVTVLLQKVRREKLSAVVGEWRFTRVDEMVCGFLTGSALMALPALVLVATGLLSFSVNSISLTIVLPAALSYLGGAVAEELLFRGFIFQRLIAGLGLVSAQLLISAYFVLTHINNPGMQGSTAWLAGANIFIASLVFGYLYWRTQSLVMPIAMHFAANWVQGSVLGFGVSGQAASGWLSPQLIDVPHWLSGGDFGLEASVLGLMTISLIGVRVLVKPQWLIVSLRE
jgi:membrane protease YdiL (CAAX protease family)